MSDSVEENRLDADFDHRDHESAYSPWPRWARLRKEAPIAHSEKYGGMYVLSRYKDIFDAARDPQTFSSRQVNIPQKPTPPLPPVMFDPPEHGGYRQIVNPFFSPAKVAEYEPMVRRICDGYTEKLLQQDSFDATTDLSLRVTYDVTMEVLGITDAPAELREWVEDLQLNRNDPEHRAKQIGEFLSAEVGRRREALGEDVISALINAQYEGRRPLTHDEVVNTTFLLVLAGLDTTTSAISGAVWYLVQNPEAQKTLLAADDRAWRLALEEFVRWVGPSPVVTRVVREDTEFKGCPMRGGSQTLLLWGSGNRDETEFPDPDKVILDRFPNRHLGFGMGTHRCLGSHLAKAELRAVLEGLLKGLSQFRLTSPDDVVWETAASNRGIRRLPLVRI